MCVLIEKGLHEAVLYNYTLVIKIFLHNVSLYMTHFESICQSGMTHPTHLCTTSRNDIVECDFKMEIDTVPNINIRGC